MTQDATLQEIARELTVAYFMEMDSIMNYIANSINLDGIRSEEIKNRSKHHYRAIFLNRSEPHCRAVVLNCSEFDCRAIVLNCSDLNCSAHNQQIIPQTPLKQNTQPNYSLAD
jgi:hypothetical protein